MRPWAAYLAFFFSVTNAFAWNTETPVENTKTDWQSLYVSTPIRTDTTHAWHNNEHARLAHMAMKQLGLDNFYSIRGPSLTAIDLNTSLFRPFLRLRGTFHDLKASPLEERLLPPPVHFAGLPDISYTMYDWINKNALCPPGIPSRGGKPADGCHAFKGWMGALNSSHFGTQAELWYRHLHAIALDLAGRAREMRKKMRQHGPKTVEAYKDYLKEAEYEALAFEGYAQHFLQDRWSIGHMWERWNAADYHQLVFKAYYDNFEAAAASGLMHGSEAITDQPDPLSSPFLNVEAGSTLIKKLFGKSSYVPYIVPEWRHIGLVGKDKAKAPILQREGGLLLDKSPHTGVGDNRVGDMLDHLYGKEFGYPDKPLEVGIQEENMLRCMMGGWVDVIKGFGLNKGSGGYGVNGVKLPNGITGLSEDVNLKIGCFDNWATNRSMALGWTDLVTTFGSFARIALGYLEDKSDVGTVIDYIRGKPEKRILNNNRTAWVKITYRVWRYALTNPDGTNLARGGIGSFGRIQHGGKYRTLPDYIEPEDLEELPDGLDKNGRDKKAVFGFFNRAHTDWWCNEGLAELNEWRGSEDKTEQAACRLIADRYYGGTDRAYQGKQKETRTMNGSAVGEEVVPVCSMYNREIPDSGYDERMPVTLAPGYVAEPYTRSADDSSTESIANWCKEIPVLDLLPQPENANEDLVALVRDPKHDILLRGQNLGDQPGTLTLDDSIIITKSNIVDWDRLGIVFRPAKGRELEEKDYSVKVTRADGVSSVGRFFLRVSPKEDTPAADDRAGCFEMRQGNALAGCWSWIGEDDIIASITKAGTHLLVTVREFDINYPDDSVPVDLTYTGFLSQSKLDLVYHFNDPEEVGHFFPMPEDEPYLKFLIQADVESRYRLRIKRDDDFDPELNIDACYLTGQGPLINRGVGGWGDDSVLEFVDPTTGLDLIITKNDWFGSMEENGNIVWTRHKNSGLNVTSTIVTDSTFSHAAPSVKTGDRIWVKAKASSGCPGIRDHFETAIIPEDHPDVKTFVMLSETGPDTLEFRSSAEGVVVGGKASAKAEDSRPEHKEQLIQRDSSDKHETQPVQDSASYGKEFLMEQQAESRSQLLEEMRRKNDRLMQNPQADTSLYDKEIKRLKEKIDHLQGHSGELR